VKEGEHACERTVVKRPLFSTDASWRGGQVDYWCKGTNAILNQITGGEKLLDSMIHGLALSSYVAFD